MIKSATPNYLMCFVTYIVQYVFLGIKLLFFQCPLHKFAVAFFVVLTNIGFLTLLGMYSSLVDTTMQLDTALKYIMSNECSDDVLQTSVTNFVKEFSRTRTLIIVGECFVILSTLLHLIVSWKLLPLAEVFTKKNNY